jgi:hypothetical protein
MAEFDPISYSKANKVAAQMAEKANQADLIALETRLDSQMAEKANQADLTALETRVDTIITTPVDGVSAQEIIDARQGAATLGANIEAFKNDYTTYKDSNNLKIAKIEKDLNDYQQAMSSINPNQEPKQKVNGYGTVSLPKNAANGQVSSVGIKGLTATNLVKNGDFSNGTTGWGAVYGNITANNNIATHTINNGLRGDIKESGRHKAVIGNKLFVRAKVRVTNSQCQAIRLIIVYLKNNAWVGQDLGGLLNPVENQWYNVFAVLELRDGLDYEDYNLVIRHQYEDENTALGKQMEVKEVIMIDLTAHGLDHLTAEEVNTMLPNWFDDTKSTVGAMRLKSVGKNLVKNDYKLWEKGTWAGNGSGQGIDSKTRIRDINIQYGLLPNQIYTLKTYNPAMDVGYILYDNLGNNLTAHITWDSQYTFTMPSNGTGIRKFLRYKDNRDMEVYEDFTKSQIQLEKGTTATPYEPYTESTQYVVAKDEQGNIAELRSLPNGTKDEISVTNRKLIKRIGEKSNIANGMVIDFADMAEGGTYYAWNDDGETETGVKGDTLGIDATTLIYQLATPIEIPIQTSGSLVSYPSGTVYIEPFVADAGIYADKMEVLYSDLPIKALEKISKVDFATGLETELDVSKTVIAGDKLSFTHRNLEAGDIVFFVYEYDRESTVGETEISYYDSRYVIKGEDDKFYQWEIEAKLVEGVITPSIKLVEV